jgi:hypothetical protein
MDDFTPDAWETVAARRAERPDGMLYLDQLFELAGLNSPSGHAYPPTDLHSLFQSIDHCYFDLLKRNCLKLVLPRRRFSV